MSFKLDEGVDDPLSCTDEDAELALLQIKNLSVVTQTEIVGGRWAISLQIKQ